MKSFLRRRRFRPRPLTTRRKLSLAAIAAIPVLAIFTFGNRGIIKRVQLQMEADNLYQQIAHDRAVGDSLRGQIKLMTTDTAATERLARERYGMVRPGETIYRVTQ
jgi:cell division protein FtsB